MADSQMSCRIEVSGEMIDNRGEKICFLPRGNGLRFDSPRNEARFLSESKEVHGAAYTSAHKIKDSLAKHILGLCHLS
jgi:hypothetical protein